MTNVEVARRWAQGLAGDWMALAELASPDMRVWHSTDDEWLDRAASTERMETAGAMSEPPSFRQVRTLVTERGFVVQAVIDRDGAPAHIVQVLTVEQGLVVACEEYIAPQEQRA